MAKIEKINISEKSDDDSYYVKNAYLEKNKGIKGDRYYDNFKEKKEQVTLIDKSEIESFNRKINQKINYKDFRRNIITSNINLNQLVGKKIKIGRNVILYIHELCQPCKYLQDKLSIQGLVKLLLNKSGVRAEIINTGLIEEGDEIIILD